MVSTSRTGRRTHEGAIRVDASGIIDASHQNSTIQAPPCTLMIQVRGWMPCSIRVWSTVGRRGREKDTEYAYSVPRSIVENSPTSAKLADCPRWAPRSPEVEVPSCYIQVGCLKDSGCRRRVGSNGAHDAVCWKVP